MADPTTTELAAETDLALFQSRNSRDGRLLHYARGRIAGVLLRQGIAAFGAGCIALLNTPAFGALLAIQSLMGEAFEIVVLRLVIARLEQGHVGRLTTGLALVAAGVQGLTVALCIALTWRLIPLHEARLFGAAFLVSAVINAGLSRPHFPAGANLRLALFLATSFAMVATDLQNPAQLQSIEYGYFAASLCLLVFISTLFIHRMERNYEHRRQTEFALLTHQHAQDLAGIELARALQDNERLALVAKYANDSILISDPQDRILWVNDAFTRITGYSHDEAVGRLPAELLNAPQTDQATLDRLVAARRAGRAVRAEILNRSKSGREMWMETSMIPVFDAEGSLTLWIAVEREITEAKAREQELARARIEAEEAGQSKARFLANMSHEIRTPMNGVIGVAELLADTRLTPTQSSYVETILESGNALLGVINDILDLAKLHSGKSVLVNRPFSPRACILGVLRVVEPAARKKGLVLRLAPDAADGEVMGDEGKVRQIVMNLVGNAVKFTSDGAVTVTLRLPDAGHPLLEVGVTDTGIGIAPERISAIFESFSQADDGIARQFGGTGLGLTISAMLARQMGGEIAVQSEIGRGSTFTFRAALPLAPDVGIQLRTDRRKIPRLRPGLTILVAEDNRTNMMIARKMLQSATAVLNEAVNGAEAVALYRRAPPDLVLMDVSMPVMDGLQAAREIRAHEAAMGLPRCPIIALTANAFGEDREACRLAGFDAFLVKPLSRIDLLTAISEQCSNCLPRHRKIGL